MLVIKQFNSRIQHDTVLYNYILLQSRLFQVFLLFTLVLFIFCFIIVITQYINTNSLWRSMDQFPFERFYFSKPSSVKWWLIMKCKPNTTEHESCHLPKASGHCLNCIVILYIHINLIVWNQKYTHNRFNDSFGLATNTAISIILIFHCLLEHQIISNINIFRHYKILKAVFTLWYLGDLETTKWVICLLLPI